MSPTPQSNIPSFIFKMLSPVGLVISIDWFRNHLLSECHNERPNRWLAAFRAVNSICVIYANFEMLHVFQVCFQSKSNTMSMNSKTAEEYVSYVSILSCPPTSVSFLTKLLSSSVRWDIGLSLILEVANWLFLKCSWSNPAKYFY